MKNLQTLEELRTKEEIIDYFKQLGKEITEEELYALKLSYDQAQESNDALTMQQLDDVAGGVVFTMAAFLISKLYFDKKISEYKSANSNKLDTEEAKREIYSLESKKGMLVGLGVFLDCSIILTATTQLKYQKSNNDNDTFSRENLDNINNLNEVANYDSSAYNGYLLIK